MEANMPTFSVTIRRVLASLVFAAAIAALHAPVSACQMQTYIIHGKVVTCTTCGNVTNCF